MLAPETFTARWFKAVSARHAQARVLFWWPLMAVIGLFVVAALLDAPVSLALQSWPESERAFFRFITDLGKSDWMLIPTAIAWVLCMGALRLPLAYSWRWAVRGVANVSAFVFVGVAVAGMVTVILKRFIGRSRPMHYEEHGVLYFAPFDLLDWTIHSFPSGHATTAVAFAVVIHTFTNGRFGGWIIAFGIAIGLSRLVGGDHYLTDVIAGTFIGLSFGILVRDWFATNKWGMRVENGKVHYRMFSAFVPLWRKLRRGHVPAALK